MRPEEIIRGLPGPPVEEWIAMLPAGTHRERHAFLVEQGLSSNHARAVLCGTSTPRRSWTAAVS